LMAPSSGNATPAGCRGRRLLGKFIRRAILFSLVLLILVVVVFVLFLVLVVFLLVLVFVVLVLVFFVVLVPVLILVIVVSDGPRVCKFAVIGRVEIGAFVAESQFECDGRDRFAEQISFFTEPHALDVIVIHRYDREGLAARFQIDDLAGRKLHFSLLDVRNARCAGLLE
jgi:hypothetical protein